MFTAVMNYLFIFTGGTIQQSKVPRSVLLSNPGRRWLLMNILISNNSRGIAITKRQFKKKNSLDWPVSCCDTSITQYMWGRYADRLCPLMERLVLVNIGAVGVEINLAGVIEHVRITPDDATFCFPGEVPFRTRRPRRKWLCAYVYCTEWRTHLFCICFLAFVTQNGGTNVMGHLSAWCSKQGDIITVVFWVPLFIKLWNNWAV